jgi:translation initiation factor 1 (eIF-1/SUI1)
MDINILNEIDKHIRIRFLKEGRASRTYIEGLEGFFTTEQVKEIINNIKKSLSTGYFCKNEDNNISHGYNGDHMERIRKILVDKYKVPSDKIKL